MPNKALIPIPADTDPPNRRCVSVQIPDDAEYSGMFWGALDELTRWNSYQRDDAHSGVLVADVWKQVISDARANECAAPCPGFYLYINDTNCPNSSDLRSTRAMDECDGCLSRERSYFSRSIIDVIAGVARIGYSCASFATDNDCGGHFCTVRAFQTGIGSPNWVLQWRDCLDTDHEITDSSSDEFIYQDFEAKWMCLSLNSNFCACVTVDGPVLCEQV